MTVMVTTLERFLLWSSRRSLGERLAAADQHRSRPGPLPSTVTFSVWCLDRTPSTSSRSQVVCSPRSGLIEREANACERQRARTRSCEGGPDGGRRQQRLSPLDGVRAFAVVTLSDWSPT